MDAVPDIGHGFAMVLLHGLWQEMKVSINTQANVQSIGQSPTILCLRSTKWLYTCNTVVREFFVGKIFRRLNFCMALFSSLWPFDNINLLHLYIEENISSVWFLSLKVPGKIFRDENFPIYGNTVSNTCGYHTLSLVVKYYDTYFMNKKCELWDMCMYCIPVSCNIHVYYSYPRLS